MKRGRYLMGVAAVAILGASPALAQIRIDGAEVQGGALVVTGEVSPPSAVTVGVGLDAIIVVPDATGRFVWIGNQVPPSCAVSVARTGERVRAGVAGCGPNPPVLVSGTTAGTTTTIYGSSGGWTANRPAPGSDWQTRSETATSTTTTTRTVRRPLFISPNDPRYALSDPDHWGQSEVEGARSGEVLYAWPERGFYGNVRGRDSN